MSAPPQRLMPRSMQTLRRLQANYRIRPTGPARLCRGPCQVGSTVTGRNETETTRVERPATQDNSQVSRCFKQNGNGYDMICMIWPLVAVALAASASNRQPGGRRRQQAAAERSRGANRPRSVATVINAKSRKKTIVMCQDDKTVASRDQYCLTHRELTKDYHSMIKEPRAIVKSNGQAVVS